MHELIISEESIESNGALSVAHAATDELIRRYGGSGDSQLTFDDLRAPSGFFLVARIEGHLAGGVGVRSIGDPHHRWGEVKRLWVRPDLRRNGNATSLMEEVLAVARTKGYSRLYLETGAAQPEAIAFYQKTGWQSIDELPLNVFSYPGAYRFMSDL